MAVYVEDDWIFMDSVLLRVDNTNYDFSDRFTHFDVATDVFSGGTVYERVFFPFLGRDVELVERLLEAGTGDVRLSGSGGIEDLSLMGDDLRELYAALALYQDLGGDFK